jgi:hypothetical protein
MKYKELLAELLTMTYDQLNCDVTVEGGEYGLAENECIAADLRICGLNHDSLDDGHPVIYIP